MKIVLRHRVTGRYYSESGKWVRRADNALAFDHVDAAREFCESHQLQRKTQPVHRLAPYVMGLLQRRTTCAQAVVIQGSPLWDFERRARFFRN